MKNLFIFTLVLFFSQTIWSQETNKEIKKELKYIEKVSYYESGQIYEQGTFNLAGKLDGHWTQFDENANVLVNGNFTNGKKTGVWLFWKTNSLTEVTFVNNKTDKINQWTKADYLAAH